MRRNGITTRRLAACLTVAAATVLWVAPPACAQARTPLLRARHLAGDAPVKVFFPSGAITIQAWDRDSIDVRGTIARGERFYLAGGDHGVKVGVMDHVDGTPVRPSTIVVRVPRRSEVSVKTVAASIDARDASGWFYSVSGPIRLTGAASSLEVESMAGDVSLDVAAPWVRARTGGGRLAIAGAPQDLDAATVRGALDVDHAAVVHGRFASVEGDIRFAGALPAGGLFEFSNHAGRVALVLPNTASALVDLSTITGVIDNAFTQIRPVAGQGGRGGTLHVQLGPGAARVTVRTFKGTITLAKESP
ncbi:MAG TPA: DUF4097 family beta strand repeat-containing protein [Gemmatimonadaceae bacterium]|jgi:hypothetical protein